LSEDDFDADAPFASDEVLEGLDSDDGFDSDADFESPDALEEESLDDLSPPFVAGALDSEESVLGVDFLA